MTTKAINNAASFSANGTVSIYATDLKYIPQNNSLAALQNLTSHLELVASTSTFMFGSTVTDVHVSASLPAGSSMYPFSIICCLLVLKLV